MRNHLRDLFFTAGVRFELNFVRLVSTAMLWFIATSYTKGATAVDCANLLNLEVANTTITSTAVIPASGSLPEYCQVQGHVDAEISFEVRLPLIWNGKFYFEGVGGAAGIIAPPGPGLARGYAEATTDTGHKGGPPIPQLDNRWALNDPKAQIDFGYLAVHVVTVAAKQIVQAFYGRMAERSYFEGCSNGGRQGLMEAQRYPTDFNGIIAGAPALDLNGNFLEWNWNAQAQHAAPIPASKIPMVSAALLEECDAKDGLRDGLISDPRRCHFDPERLLCQTGDAPNCLTSDQVRSLQQIYSGPMRADGERIYPGLPQGSEDGADAWPLWLIGSRTIPALQEFSEDGHLRYFVFGPSFDTLTINFDTDPALLVPSGEFLNATNPDLSAFKANGGKLLVWHGWSDPAITPFRTIRYFLDTVDFLGGDGDEREHEYDFRYHRELGERRKEEKTTKFFRLFLAPGVHHCLSGDSPSGGPGPNIFDVLTPLEKWVERGVAPDRIIASHLTGETVDRTRPLCPYPQEAKYIGIGSIDDATNFVCTRLSDHDE